MSYIIEMRNCMNKLHKYILVTIVFGGNIVSLQGMQLFRTLRNAPQKRAHSNLRYFTRTQQQVFFGKKDTELYKQIAALKVQVESLEKKQLSKELENRKLFAEHFNACNDLYMANENIRTNMEKGTLNYIDI